jgi:hypothetical protein
LLRKCAFLTTDHLAGFITDDELAREPFGQLGWQIEDVSWRDALRGSGVDWDRYEAVIIRTTWDYHKEPDSFLKALEMIESSRAELINPIELVRWNLHKSYLRELEERGVHIVATHWGDGLEHGSLHAVFDSLEADEIVIKPAIGASADDTFLVHRDAVSSFSDHIVESFRGREFLAQPFLQSIVDEGEYSLFYFAGEYSHTILKKPKTRDFRVQEEHGGDISAVIPETGLIESGRGLLDHLRVPPLYARVDYVRDAEGEIALMELELIEPALYFRNAPGAASQFARAFHQWMEKSAT